MKIRIIVPTREHEDNFYSHTALGRSLSLHPKLLDLDHKVEVMIFGKRAKRAFGKEVVPLPILFNVAIEQAKHDPAALLFVHDDIEIIDFFWTYHLVEGLQKWDMVGLAGNMRRNRMQSAWHNDGEDLRRGDWGMQSGACMMSSTARSVAATNHIGEGGTRVMCFGPINRQVYFLDGMFLGIHSDTFHRYGIKFDEQFAFHFYDMDLCRQFEAHSLLMGTIGISVRHEDNDSYNNTEWEETYPKYRKKWAT